MATTRRLEDAVDEVAESLINDLDGSQADLVVAFVSSHYADHYSQLPRCVAEHFPGALLVGCSAGGVIGGGEEVEGTPALSLAAATLPGVSVKPFHLASMPHRWAEAIDTDIEASPSFMLLSDPFGGNTEPLLRWLDNAYPNTTIVGGLASGANQPGDSVLFHNEEQHRSGTLGLAFSGDVHIETLVAQGCRPIGSPMFVTRAEGNELYELDGVPALTVLEDLFQTLPPRDQTLFRSSLFLGLVMNPSRQIYQRGDFLIRTIAGVANHGNAVVIAAKLREKMVVQFHVRDAETSAQDLNELLSTTDETSPRGALMFSCLGRGKHMYGKPNHDTTLFSLHHPGVPMGGFFCNGEIGPVQGQTHLHGYTSSIALFR